MTRRELKACKDTQGTVVRATGVEHSVLRGIKNDNRNIQIRVAEKLAEYLNLELRKKL